MIPYETLLDAARQHFATVAASPRYTRAARHKALELEREATAELTAANEGRALRRLVSPATSQFSDEYLAMDPEFRRAIAA